MRVQEARIARDDLAVDADAEIHPAPQQIAVVIGAVVRITVPQPGLVIAAAGTEIADTARGAVRAGAIGGAAEELPELHAIDAGVDIAESRELRAREAVTEIECAIAIDREQSHARPAGERLAPPLVKIGHQLMQIGESGIVSRERRGEILLAEA